jgi:hypothetical protein
MMVIMCIIIPKNMAYSLYSAPSVSIFIINAPRYANCMLDVSTNVYNIGAKNNGQRNVEGEIPLALTTSTTPFEHKPSQVIIKNVI